MSRHDATTTPETAAWSTRAVDADVAVDYWRAARRKAYIDVSPTPYSRFRRRDRLRELRGLRPVGQTGERREATRSRALISRGSDEEYLYVLFQRHGTGIVTQAGHSAEIRPGRVVIYDSRQPFTLDYREPYEQVVVHLPAERAFADAGLRPSTDLFAVPIDVDGAVGGVGVLSEPCRHTGLGPRGRRLSRTACRGPGEFPVGVRGENPVGGPADPVAARTGAGLSAPASQRPGSRCRPHRRRLPLIPPCTASTVRGDRAHPDGCARYRSTRPNGCWRARPTSRSNRSPENWGSSATPTSTARSDRLPV